MNIRYLLTALAGMVPVVLCGTTLFNVTPTAARSAQTELTWQKDYAAAQKAALQSGKPLFVVFR